MPSSPRMSRLSPNHERASASMRRLKPALSKKPVPVSPTKVGGQDDWHELLKKRSKEESQHLRQFLDESNTPRFAPSQSLPASSSSVPSPEEAVAIIRHQSSYIKQLENELRYCKGELSSYRTHLNQVIDENSRLAVAHQIGKMSKPMQPSMQNTENVPTQTNLPKHMQDLELLKAMHTSKTEILEQQLASTRQELHSTESKVAELKSKLLVRESLSANGGSETKFGGLCVSCCKNEALVAARFDQTSTINMLNEEKEDLIEALANIRHHLTDMQMREQEAAIKVKDSITVTEQANLEKTQALIQREQMHEEFTLLKSRFEKLVNDHQASLSDTKNAARQEVKKEISDLEYRLKNAADAECSAKVQLEKVAREKDDIARQLQQHKQELHVYQSSVVESTTGRKVDMTQLALERDMAVEERNKLKNRLVKVEQAKDESILRVKQELKDVRSRLEKAEREVILSKEENVKYVKTNQQLDKELHQSRMAYNSIDRSRNDELASATRRLEQREEELNAIINDTEHRYNKQLSDLENMYCAQNKLVGNLREELQVQAETIQRISSKYRNESKQLKHDNQVLTRQNEKMRERSKVLDSHEVEHERIHKKLRSKVQQLDEENRSLMKQSNELAAKNSEYMREVDILSGEVKFLQAHLGREGGDGTLNSSGKSHNHVVDDLLCVLKDEMVSQDKVLTGGIDVCRDAAKGDR